jgi:hypothetical protein
MKPLLELIVLRPTGRMEIAVPSLVVSLKQLPALA